MGGGGAGVRGASCGSSPGPDTNNQVTLYTDISFVACNKGLLLPEPYEFLSVSACCSHGDVFQKLSVSHCQVMVLYCVGPILCLLLLKTNWVHEGFFHLFSG